MKINKKEPDYKKTGREGHTEPRNINMVLAKPTFLYASALSSLQNRHAGLASLLLLTEYPEKKTAEGKKDLSKLHFQVPVYR